MWSAAAKSFLLMALVAGAASAQAQLQVTQVIGSAEGQQAGVWRPLSGGPLRAAQLRTGAGQVELRSGSGTVLLNTAVQARVNNGKIQVLAGQAYVTGPVQLYVGRHHFNVAAGSTARVDLLRAGDRVAVLSGTARLAYGSRTINLSAGEQLSLSSLRVSAYRETDPWYQARITGPGNVVIEALHGDVKVGTAQFRTAAVGQTLAAGQRVRTGVNSWAELGFSGGGYLRLQASSELEVTAVQTSTRGREVLLQLNRGSAWNVVQSGQGSYRVTTPVLSTAVRGTVFRVDADGQVKVFEGEVEAGSATVPTGQQLTGGQVGDLQPDAQDELNRSLDSLRDLPLALRDLTVPGGPLTIEAAPLTELRLEARSASGVVWSWPLRPQPELLLDSEGRPASLEPVRYGLSPVGTAQLAALRTAGPAPLNDLSFRVVAQRYAQREELPLSLPPKVGD